MSDATEIRSLVARLVAEPPPDRESAPPGRRLYRPLVVGPVLMRRPSGRGPWLARVSADGRLVPRAAARLRSRISLLRRRGVLHRVAAALVTPQDFAGPTLRMIPSVRRATSEFYGWSIMYQLPGMRSLAAIDPHERFPELPAFFESPYELVDRCEFLAGRGIPTRPLALITQPIDFSGGRDGKLGNRFYPGERFRPPVDLEWFA